MTSEQKKLDSQNRIYIRVKDSSNTALLEDLRKIIDEKKGESEVVLVVGDPNNKKAIKLPSRFDISQSTLSRLSELVGNENVKTSS